MNAVVNDQTALADRTKLPADSSALADATSAITDQTRLPSRMPNVSAADDTRLPVRPPKVAKQQTVAKVPRLHTQPATARPELANNTQSSQPSSSLQGAFERLEESVSRVIVGKSLAIRLCLTAAFAGGHILLEDQPGTGKTQLARALSQSLGLDHKRMQFTPDLLPSDLLGVTIYQQTSKRWSFRPGPVFTQVLLADEINRASPKVQSALLEVMEEGQVTLDGHTRALAGPFIVVATQNDSSQLGTYPLPEAQLDRFLISTSLGDPGHEASLEILTQAGKENNAQAPASLGTQAFQELQQQARAVYASPAILEYVVRLLEASRHSDLIERGSSIRGGLGIVSCARVWAGAQGRDYVIPDDVQALLLPVLAHRITLSPQARIERISKREVLEEVSACVPVPQAGECT